MNDVKVLHRNVACVYYGESSGPTNAFIEQFEGKNVYDLQLMCAIFSILVYCTKILWSTEELNTIRSLGCHMVCPLVPPLHIKLRCSDMLSMPTSQLPADSGISI